MLEGRPEFEVVAAVGTADQAEAVLKRQRVDVVVLDVEMPGTDGLTALPTLLAAGDGARVLIVSSAAEAGATATMRALMLGAADTLLKPHAGGFAGSFADQFVDRVGRIGYARVRSERTTTQTMTFVSETADVAGIAPAPERPGGASVAIARTATGGRIDCLAIGASTGGLHALSAFLRALPEAFRAPILITQHLPPVFMPYFAQQLQDIAARPASVARDGDMLKSGEILVAPGDAHISLSRFGVAVRVVLDRTSAQSGCLPSVDPMFEAVATTFGVNGVGVVLTGMGRDGTIGARALAAAGAEILAQDAATSVVWGMPGSVAREGLASAVMPPEKLALRVGKRAIEGART